MMNEDYKSFDIVIVGLGKTGFACASYLAKQKMKIAITDTRDKPPYLDKFQAMYPGVPLYLGQFNQELLINAKQILISPGISMTEPEIAAACRAGVTIYGDIEYFCQQTTVPVIAVTGSNGKSTVTTLIAEMARSAGKQTALGGNIGTPVMDLLDDDKTELFVLELSSYQLETVSSLNAVAAVVLNISEDHLERYSGLQDYANIKSKIFAGDGTMIINIDDPYVVAMHTKNRNTIEYTLGEPEIGQFGVREYDGESWLVKGEEKLIPADKLALKGRHNIGNSLAALALADAIQLPIENSLRVLETFTGLPHRCQWIAKINDVDWYNDSKGTNVAACCAAVTGLANAKNCVLIAGGEAKGPDFSQLAVLANDYLRAVIVIGRDAKLIKSALQDTVTVHEADTMESAVSTAAKIAVPGNIVLLSPACASFDMFEDYQDRGNTFTNEVLKLVNK